MPSKRPMWTMISAPWKNHPTTVPFGQRSMFNKLRETHGKVAAKPFLDKLGLAVDLGMIGLVISNLVLIVFDWLFSANIVASALADYTPTFHDFYDGTIHQNFITYDLIF